MKRTLYPLTFLLIALPLIFACKNPTQQPSVVDYAITYDPNGATGGSPPVDSNRYAHGVTVIVMGNDKSLAKANYTFAGWNTKADDTGTALSGATFAMGNADVELYALWSTTYTVTYSPNNAAYGSVPVDSNYYLPGASATVSGNTGGLLYPGYRGSRRARSVIFP